MKGLVIVTLALAIALLFGCTQVGGSYTSADVAGHNSPTDCWVIRDGNVYNITPMTSASPNTPFAQACGTDITQAFSNFNPQGTDFNASGRDFNYLARDFNGTRPDFNGMPRDFNGTRPDFNGTRPDFNSQRMGPNGPRQGRGFTQYYIGTLAD